jgi:hypothetical protein
MGNVVYIKILHYENGVVYPKQKVCTIIDKDQYDSVTVKYYNDETKEYETRALLRTQYSETPFLMDFD